jgi:flagellar basal body P-ring formation protein FlgA
LVKIHGFEELIMRLPAYGGLVLSLCLAVTAKAQTVHSAELQELAQQWVQTALQAAEPGRPHPLRMEVVVGQIDSRLKLAPCGNVDPYLPVSAKLWGRTRLGLRCVDGMSRWNITLPLTVHAWGPAWVVKTPVPSGAIVTQDHVVQAEVDWAEQAQSVLINPDLWQGHTATRVLQTGQVLRQGLVKPAQVFQAGSMVRLIAQGAGFQITGSAQALSAGVVGQTARIRLENGKISSGIVVDQRTVQINL